MLGIQPQSKRQSLTLHFVQAVQNYGIHHLEEHLGQDVRRLAESEP